VVQLLRRGLHGAILRRAIRPAAVGPTLAAAAGTAVARVRGGHPGAVRWANRTDALATALADLAFASKVMSDLTHNGLDTVLTATDLRTSNAVRFGSARSSCSRFGTIVEPVSVATAVAASAAFPLLLPAMERTFSFERGGLRKREPVLLSDGGLYDNLGISVFDPGRSSSFSLHAYDVPYVVSCDAGRGELRLRSPHFLLGRLARSFDVVHRRAQDGGRGLLHEWAAGGRIRGFVMAYLGMPDERLPIPVADLVPRQSVTSYGTNFAPMTQQRRKVRSGVSI